jgi:hypothetical protein
MSYQYSIDEYLAPLPKPTKVYMDHEGKRIDATITKDHLFVSGGITFTPKQFLEYGHRLLCPDEEYTFHDIDLLRSLNVSEGHFKDENLWWLWKKMPAFYEHAGCTLEQYVCRRVLEDLGKDSVTLSVSGTDCLVTLTSKGTFLSDIDLTQSDLTATEVIEHILHQYVTNTVAYNMLNFVGDKTNAFAKYIETYLEA